MPSETNTDQARSTSPDRRAGRWLTLGAFLASLLYLPWTIGMVLVAYVIYDFFGIDPGGGAKLADKGVWGWLANVALAVALAVPSWIGAWLATAARRRGAGGLATAALLLNLLVGVAVVVVMGVIQA